MKEKGIYKILDTIKTILSGIVISFSCIIILFLLVLIFIIYSLYKYITNNLKYIPFYEDEINYIKYDAKCYKKLLTQYRRLDRVTTLSNDYIEKTLSKKYIRLFINKRAIPLEQIVVGEKIIIQDNYFFDCENWEEILKNLSVFSTYITFENPITIYSQQDFDNYIQLLQMGFKIKCIILIEDTIELKNFILNCYLLCRCRICKFDDTYSLLVL